MSHLDSKLPPSSVWSGVAEALRGLRGELDAIALVAHGFNPALCLDSEQIGDIAAGVSTKVSSGLEDHLGLLNEAVAEILHPFEDRRVVELQGIGDGSELAGRIAKLLVDERFLDTPVDLTSRDACYEAELRLEKTLSWAESGSVAKPDHDSAVVLSDKAGEPFALQKSSGARTAFSFRNGVLPTANGPRFIPAGALFRLIFGKADFSTVIPAYEAQRGSGIVLATGNQALDISFSRFAAWALPQPVRVAAADCAIRRVPELAHYRDGAARLNDTVVAERVGRLLRGGIIEVDGYSLSQPYSAQPRTAVSFFHDRAKVMNKF